VQYNNVASTLPVPQEIRMVTNKEVDDHDVERAIVAFQEILS